MSERRAQHPRRAPREIGTGACSSSSGQRTPLGDSGSGEDPAVQRATASGSRLDRLRRQSIEFADRRDSCQLC